jgi:hypothetical protein
MYRAWMFIEADQRVHCWMTILVIIRAGQTALTLRYGRAWNVAGTINVCGLFTTICCFAHACIRPSSSFTELTTATNSLSHKACAAGPNASTRQSHGTNTYANPASHARPHTRHSNPVRHFRPCPAVDLETGRHAASLPRTRHV